MGGSWCWTHGSFPCSQSTGLAVVQVWNWARGWLRLRRGSVSRNIPGLITSDISGSDSDHVAWRGWGWGAPGVNRQVTSTSPSTPAPTTALDDPLDSSSKRYKQSHTMLQAHHSFIQFLEAPHSCQRCQSHKRQIILLLVISIYTHLKLVVKLNHTFSLSNHLGRSSCLSKTEPCPIN